MEPQLPLNELTVREFKARWPVRKIKATPTMFVHECLVRLEIADTPGFWSQEMIAEAGFHLSTGTLTPKLKERALPKKLHGVKNRWLKYEPCPEENTKFEAFFRRETRGRRGYDVGSGDGRMMVLLAILNPKMDWLGIEVRQSAVAQAQKLTDLVKSLVIFNTVQCLHTNIKIPVCTTQVHEISTNNTYCVWVYCIVYTIHNTQYTK